MDNITTTQVVWSWESSISALGIFEITGNIWEFTNLEHAIASEQSIKDDYPAWLRPFIRIEWTRRMRHARTVERRKSSPYAPQYLSW